jgi:hypothetical protein
MRSLFVLLVLVVTAVSATSLSNVYGGNVWPLTSIYLNTAYELPIDLGNYYYINAGAATWTLPLTLQNNGTVIPGTVGCIRTAGAGALTLTCTAPDTIEGASTLSVTAGSSVCFVATYGYYLLISKSTISAPSPLPTPFPSFTPQPQTTTGVTFSVTTANSVASSGGASPTSPARQGSSSGGPAPTPAVLAEKYGGGRVPKPRRV